MSRDYLCKRQRRPKGRQISTRKHFNPYMLVAHEIVADELVVRLFQGERVDFLNSIILL